MLSSFTMVSKCMPVCNALLDYQPPSWAKMLKQQPKEYIRLAMRPTPIHKWELPGVPSGFEVFVKRDDMTGSTLSGNKVRKLEFLLAEALKEGCDSIVTCGGIQSNHSRTTALAARQIGLDTHLILRWPGEMDPNTVGVEGNILLDRVAGAKIVLVPIVDNYDRVVDGKRVKGLQTLMLEYTAKMRSDGHIPYVMPIGGSSPTGVWGYLEAFREMMEQGALEEFDDIVIPAGSGGTVCGVAIANYLTGSKLKVHGVCLHLGRDSAYYLKHISDDLKVFGLTTDDQGHEIRAEDLVDIIEGYNGTTTDKNRAQLIDIVSATGISLDTTYTFKSVRGMLGELNSNPGRFAGKRILYIHTGGMFGLYDGGMDEQLQINPKTSQIFGYHDIIPK